MQKKNTSITPTGTSPSESRQDLISQNLEGISKSSVSEVPSIKSKQSQIIQERTKQQFLSNPLFQESNPNAEKNKQTYINTLVNKGYNKGDLELLNKATTRAKQQVPEKGILDMTEAEVSKAFWDKTTDAFMEGYRQTKEGFMDMVKPSMPHEGKTVDEFVNTPLKDESISEKVNPYLKAALGVTTVVASPVMGVFGVATDEIKKAADKHLPEPAAKVVGEALPTIFSLAHKAASAVGYNPEHESSGDILLSFADMMIGGKVLHSPIKGYEKIKSMEDLKEISQKAANGELNPEELKSYEKVVDEIKNTSLADIKKTAEESNTPQGDVIASKIADIEQPSAEHKVSPEIENLEKQKEDLESDKQKLEEKSPGSGEVLDNAINDVTTKLEDAHNAEGDLTAGEGLNNVIHSELDGKISELEASKEGLSASGKESIDKQIQELKTKKDALQKPETSSVLQHPQEGIGEEGSGRGGMEQSQQGIETPETSQKEKGINESSIASPENVTSPAKEDSKTIGTTHAKIQESRLERGLDELEKDAKIGNEERWDEVKSKVVSGDLIPDSIARDIIEKKRPASADEVLALDYERIRLTNEKEGLQEKVDKLYEEGKVEEAASLKEDLRHVEDKINRNDEAAFRSSSEWGKSGQIRQRLFSRDYSMTAIERTLKRDSNGRELTQEQKNFAKSQADKIEQLNKKLAKLSKEKESTQKVKEPKTSEQVAKAKENLDKARDEFRRKIAGSLSSGGLQAIPEFVKLTKAYIDYGIANAKEFIKAFREDFPESKHSDKDIEDAFESINKELSDEKKADNIIKNLEKHIEKINEGIKNLKEGKTEQGEIYPEKGKPKPKVTNDKIEALRKKRDELKKDRESLIPKDIKDKAALEKYRKNKKKQLANLEEKLAKGDVLPKERKGPPENLDKDIEKTLIEIERAKAEIEAKREEIRLENMGRAEKVLDLTSRMLKFAIFTSSKGMMKLALAALYRPVIFPVELLARGVLSNTPWAKELYKKDPAVYSKSIFDSAQFKDYYKTFFNKNTVKEAFRELGKGSEFTAKYGKPEVEAKPLHKFLAYPQKMHAVMKSFPKMAKFESAYNNALSNLVDSGLDPKEASTQNIAIEYAKVEAYSDIFMQDNMAAKQLNAIIEKTKSSEDLKNQLVSYMIQSTMPVIKVPLNFFNEVLNQIPLVGLANTLQIVARSGERGKYKSGKTQGGIENLTPEQAQKATRALTSAFVGTVGLSIGYALYKKYGDDAEDKLKDNESYLHNSMVPLIESGMEIAKESEALNEVPEASYDALSEMTKKQTLSLPPIKSPMAITRMLKSKDGFINAFGQSLYNYVPSEVKSQVKEYMNE